MSWTQKRPEPMPLDQLPADTRARIEEAVARPYPPEKWKLLGNPDDPFPVAAIISRAWTEWHRRRGRDPFKEREPIPKWMRRAVIERDGYFCGICRGGVDPSDVHLDHITPWSAGGPTTPGNLRVTHATCNIKKGARVDAAENDA